MRYALGILAGGAGSRAGGRDKGWITVRGRAQIEHVLEQTGDGAARRLVSANRHQEAYAALGLEVVTDRWPGMPGPLAGVASLLAATSEDWLLTVAVDLARLPRDFAARMLALRDPAGVVIAADEGAMQPLFALYPSTFAAHAIESFERGRRSVRDWQQDFVRHTCHFAGIRFGNLNALQEFESR